MAEVFYEDFSSLDMTTSTHEGRWRPCDVWQDINKGFVGAIAGKAYMVNPNQHPAYTPFEITPAGFLRIKAFRTPPALTTSIRQTVKGKVPTWCGGFLITNTALQTFKYGLFEFRVRFPNPGAGMFPAVWLYGAHGSSDPLNKGCAEIDVLEIFGKAAGKPWGTYLHFHNNSNNEVMPAHHVGVFDLDTTGWHTYAMDWQPTFIKFYYDGNQIAEVTGPQAQWFSTEMAIRMNFQMDATWFLTTDHPKASTPSPMFMDVDFVRVTQ